MDKPKELLIEVTPDGQWIFPEQKKRNRAYSCAMPIDSLVSMIASNLGQKRDLIKSYKFKIVASKHEGI